MRSTVLSRYLARALLIVALAAACDPGASTPRSIPKEERDAIRIASFDFTESRILAEIYATALEAAGYPVDRKLGVASREILEPALEQDRVDLVPEYMGTALTFVTLGAQEPSSNPASTHRSLENAFAREGIAVLDYAPAQNKNGIVVTEETAHELELEHISDLEPVAPYMAFGGPPECPERPLCLLGLRDTYGLSFSRFQPLDAGGPLTVATLLSGEVEVALLFTTDPNIEANDLRLLEDDRDLQPAENVVPVVREEVIARHGDAIVSLLDAITHRLTTDDLRDLNAEVDLRGAEPSAVAAQWLRTEGPR
ncbi:ABC transporter substrate-binding protein [soil metagenome]